MNQKVIDLQSISLDEFKSLLSEYSYIDSSNISTLFESFKSYLLFKNKKINPKRKSIISRNILDYNHKMLLELGKKNFYKNQIEFFVKDLYRSQQKNKSKQTRQEIKMLLNKDKNWIISSQFKTILDEVEKHILPDNLAKIIDDNHMDSLNKVFKQNGFFNLYSDINNKVKFLTEDTRDNLYKRATFYDQIFSYLFNGKPIEFYNNHKIYYLILVDLLMISPKIATYIYSYILNNVPAIPSKDREILDLLCQVNFIKDSTVRIPNVIVVKIINALPDKVKETIFYEAIDLFKHDIEEIYNNRMEIISKFISNFNYSSEMKEVIHFYFKSILISNPSMINNVIKMYSLNDSQKTYHYIRSYYETVLPNISITDFSKDYLVFNFIYRQKDIEVDFDKVSSAFKHYILNEASFTAKDYINSIILSGNKESIIKNVNTSNDFLALNILSPIYYNMLYYRMQAVIDIKNNEKTNFHIDLEQRKEEVFSYIDKYKFDNKILLSTIIDEDDFKISKTAITTFKTFMTDTLDILLSHNKRSCTKKFVANFIETVFNTVDEFISAIDYLFLSYAVDMNYIRGTRKKIVDNNFYEMLNFSKANHPVTNIKDNHSKERDNSDLITLVNELSNESELTYEKFKALLKSKGKNTMLKFYSLMQDFSMEIPTASALMKKTIVKFESRYDVLSSSMRYNNNVTFNDHVYYNYVNNEINDDDFTEVIVSDFYKTNLLYYINFVLKSELKNEIMSDVSYKEILKNEEFYLTEKNKDKILDKFPFLRKELWRYFIEGIDGIPLSLDGNVKITLNSFNEVYNNFSNYDTHYMQLLFSNLLSSDEVIENYDMYFDKIKGDLYEYMIEGFIYSIPSISNNDELIVSSEWYKDGSYIRQMKSGDYMDNYFKLMSNYKMQFDNIGSGSLFALIESLPYMMPSDYLVISKSRKSNYIIGYYGDFIFKKLSNLLNRNKFKNLKEMISYVYHKFYSIPEKVKFFSSSDKMLVSIKKSVYESLLYMEKKQTESMKNNSHVSKYVIFRSLREDLDNLNIREITNEYKSIYLFKIHKFMSQIEFYNNPANHKKLYYLIRRTFRSGVDNLNGVCDSNFLNKIYKYYTASEFKHINNYQGLYESGFSEYLTTTISNVNIKETINQAKVFLEECKKDKIKMNKYFDALNDSFYNGLYNTRHTNLAKNVVKKIKVGYSNIDKNNYLLNSLYAQIKNDFFAFTKNRSDNKFFEDSMIGRIFFK